MREKRERGREEGKERLRKKEGGRKRQVAGEGG